MTATKILEKTVIKQLITWLKARYGNEVKIEKRHGHRFGATGEPDLSCCIRGRSVQLEVKRPGGKPTAMQLWQLEEWRAAGAVTGVVTCVEELEELLHAGL